MDSISQLTDKIMAERARQQQPATHQPTHTAPPPPYTESEDSDSDADSDADPNDEEPMKLIINASHAVHGSNNLVPTSPSALADATKFSSILLNAVTQLNTAANARLGHTRPLRVDLTINCGVSVVGNRNVIGNVSFKPKAPTLTANGFVAPPAQGGAEPGQASVAGAKRKAEDDDTAAEQPAAKRQTAETYVAGGEHTQP